VIGPPKAKCDPALVGDSIEAPARSMRATAQAWGKKRHFYKRLPKEFRRDGFNYRQVAREGDIAIYQQVWSGCADPSVCYGVIRIKRREGFVVDSRFIPPAEVYPRSEQWGELGWTFCNKDAAFAILRELE